MSTQNKESKLKMADVKKMSAAFEETDSEDNILHEKLAIIPGMVKTKSKLDIEKETFEKAYCKLVTVSIVSVFFIIC